MKIARAGRAALHRVGVEVSRYPRATPYAVDLKGHLDTLAVTSVVDVGAHRGQFGSLLRSIGYTGRIVSFEPQAAEYERLVRRAGGDPGWVTHRLALGAEAGEGVLNVADGTVLTSFLPASPSAAQYFGGRIEAVARESVPVVTLSSLDILDGSTFLKIDTQGFELEVLRGAGERLAEVAAVQAEVALLPVYIGAPTFRELLDFMEQGGFILTGVHRVSRDSRSLELREVDCLWRRRG